MKADLRGEEWLALEGAVERDRIGRRHLTAFFAAMIHLAAIVIIAALAFAPKPPVGSTTGVGPTDLDVNPAANCWCMADDPRTICSMVVEGGRIYARTEPPEQSVKFYCMR